MSPEWTRVNRFSFAGCVTAFFLLLVLSFALYLGGEYDAIVIWWSTTMLLLVPMTMSLFTKSATLNMFVSVCFLTNFIGIPWFVINQNRYTYSGWTAVKSFQFTALEFSQIYVSVAIFLILVVTFFVVLKYVSTFCLAGNFKHNKFHGNSRLRLKVEKKASAKHYLMLIILISLTVPLNLWMFRNGIGLTGIEPPRLPFRLSGILYYLTRYILPILLFYLYSKTSRTALPASILLFYALFLGFSQVSRASLILVILPVLIHAFYDRRKVLFIAASIWVLGAVQLVSIMRNVVYVFADGKLYGNTSLGFTNSVYEFSSSQMDIIYNFSLVETGMAILARVQSPQNLVLGYQFDPQAIGGVKILLKRFFYEGMFPVDSDAFHLEWIASTLPAGTAATGGFMSNVVSISQVQPLLLPIVAFVTAFYLVLGEWLACAISRKYSSAIVYYSIACVYIFALIIWVGSAPFLGLLLILILVYLFPRIKLRLKIQHKQDRSVSKKAFLIDQV